MYEVETAEAIRPKTATQRSQKRWERNGRDMRETDGAYLAKPFVAWDGEGVTIGNEHRYVMLAVKSADGDEDYMEDVLGISTRAALDFIWEFSKRQNPKAIHVIYGGGYDFNMIFRDIPRKTVERLYRGEFAFFANYKLSWRAGKSLWLCRVDSDKKNEGTGVTLFDVVPFFQCAFVKACDSYLGDRFYKREMVAENKQLRSSFTLADLEEVKRYNDAELTNLLMLVEELRIRLNACGLRPRRWDGPGAIAAALLRRENVKDSMAVCPDEVAEAARFAYAGGRFEVLKYGIHDAPAFEYDVNSAYPAALINVPDLTAGVWIHDDGDAGDHTFALYHVEYHGNEPTIPGAFFRRDPNGTVCYPMNVTGWYWAPEVATAREYCARGYGEMRIIESWRFAPDPGAHRPFGFIEPLYAMRKKLKAAKDGAHVGIKLGLNSLYGKLAQQVGARWDEEFNRWNLPPFHQLEWAGFATSYCRARVLSAALDNIHDVIAFETDALFTTVELDNVQLGDQLGDFERVPFDNLTYVQSGLYFGDSPTEGKVEKTRGVDRGSMVKDDVTELMSLPVVEDRAAVATLTRFIGAGIALAQSWKKWRTWETINKRMKLFPSGKRVHAGCECQRNFTYDENGIVPEPLRPGLHTTVCPFLNHVHSLPFPVAWINPNPEMSELAELREREVISYD